MASNELFELFGVLKKIRKDAKNNTKTTNVDLVKIQFEG